jgi:hypothetical protein
MEIKNAIMQMAEQDPQYEKAIDMMEAQVARMPIVPEDLDEAIQILEFVLQNPDKYQEVREGAIKDGDIDANMFPEQFDQVFIVSLLVALYGVQDRLKTQGYARGGLAVAARRLQSAGRGGDTQLAHINSREAEMLKRMGGSGAINPNTGLHEYKSGKQLFATLAPIALAIFVPGLGAAIGSALGASGIGASMLGGAIIGGASSAIGGGDWKKGALMGGLGGGLGSYVGGAADKALGLGLGQTGQAILGSGLVGAGAGAITGQGVVKGALQGVAGGAIGQLAGGYGGPSAFEQGVTSAGQSFGNALTAGYDPKTAATVGLTSGIMQGIQTGMSAKPSDAVVDGLKTGETAAPKTVTLPDGTVVQAPGTTGVDAQGRTGTYQLDTTTGKVGLKVDAGSYQVNPQTGTVEWKAAEPGFWDKALKGSPFESTTSSTTTPGAKADTGISAGKVVGALGLMSALQKPPPAAQEAIAKMSPEQQEYFNRPSVAWDWNKMQTDANASNMSLDQFMAANWPKITGYAQTQPGEVAAQQGSYNIPQAPVVNKARGGALSAVARFAQGAGSGRADTIDAKLSDGEYVIDAETVAMLGDGSNKEGAKRLDAMRQNIRSHKGKALSKGKFSPNAKSPLAYLKEFA